MFTCGMLSTHGYREREEVSSWEGRSEIGAQGARRTKAEGMSLGLGGIWVSNGPVLEVPGDQGAQGWEEALRPPSHVRAFAA